MKRKTIMIVGAGLGQLPAILSAKRMGLRVIAVDKVHDAPGMEFADVALPIDVVDMLSVVKAANEHEINAVMTIQSDLPVATVGKVVDALGLIGVSYQTAMDCSNKIRTRLRFKEKNIPQPAFRIVSSIKDTMKAVKEIGYPCIIKAPDSSGSRGVRKVKSKDDIQIAYDEAFKHSKSKKILVEEYIKGLEIGAQAFSRGGKCTTVLLHNDTLSEPPYMVPIGHSFPVRIESEKADFIIKNVKRAIEALCITEGPSNVDLILPKNGEPKIIEVGARIGATCLPELVYCFSGIDWVKAAIEAALGQKSDLTQKKYMPCAAGIIEAPADGIFSGYNIPEDIYNVGGIVDIEIEADIGKKISRLRNGTDRIGRIVVCDKDSEKAEAKIEWIKSRILIEVNQGNLNENCRKKYT